MGKLENKTSELHGVMLFFDNCKALKFLTDEEAGKLFKNIANYVCGEELIELDGRLKETKPSAAFIPLRRYVFSMIQTAQYMLKRQM